MRIRSLAGASAAGITLLMTVAPGASIATPVPALPLSPAAARPFASRAAAPPPRRKPFAAPAGCSTNYSANFFLGIPAGHDVAGGNVSAVLGGYANQACDTDDAIGGGYDNIIGSSADGGVTAQTSFVGAGQMNGIAAQSAFIGAGDSNGANGYQSFIGAGSGNSTAASSAFVGAGENNKATGLQAFGGAGISNTVSGISAFVGAGQENVASASSAFVGAGDENVASADGSLVGNGSGNTASAIWAFVGDGAGNTASGILSFVGAGGENNASGNGAFIGGGGFTYLENCEKTKKCSTPLNNHVSGDDSFIGAGDQNDNAGHEAFIGSGYANSIGAVAAFGTVGGGYENSLTGEYATIPGGYGNEAAGELSFAAGYHAEAVNNGSFVWSDHVASSAFVKDTAANEFVVRASGGTVIYSSETLASGVSLAQGSGTWSSLSDRNAKTDIAPLDDAAVLAKVASLPVSAWRYKTETGVRHVGPMAQDFYAAFGVGEDDRHITSIDEDGVALAAIKALDRENRRLRGENAAIRARAARTDARLTALERIVLGSATRASNSSRR